MPHLSRSLSLALCGWLAGFSGGFAETYRAPAHVRVFHGDEAIATMDAIVEAEGAIIGRGKGWFDAILPQDLALKGQAAMGLTEGARFEVLDKNIDDQLKRFDGRPNAGVYHTVAEVESEIAQLVENYPDLISSESIGTTFEGRPVRAVRISSQGDDANLPTFFVCGMHHAREWISVEVPMGLIHQLVENYASDPEIRALVDSREIWVIPVLNPDGLEYSQTKKRMWRKNRRKNSDNSYGVDLNRNWGYQWGKKGASTRPSSDTYRGTEAFSEPELVALRDLALRERPTASLSFHSYGQLVLWPCSYDYDVAPDDLVLAHHAREMAKLNGYEAKQSAGLYPASGDFDDWFHGVLGAMSYTFELGKQFVPDEAKVPGIVEKNLKAVHYYLKNCADVLPLLSHQVPEATTNVQDSYPVSFKLSPRLKEHNTIQSATLSYTTAAGTTAQVAMTLTGDTYKASIPADGYGTVHYSLQVLEDSGRTHRFPATGEHTFRVVEALYVLVDDDAGKNYQQYYIETLNALEKPFQIVTTDALTVEQLLGASGVIWFTGEDTGSAITRPEQEILNTYLAAGGELLLFGQDVAYAISTSKLLTEALRVKFVKDVARGTTLKALPEGFLKGQTFTINQGQGIRQKFPDSILARDGGVTLLTFKESEDDSAVSHDSGVHKAAYFGFGLEGIDTPEGRQTLLGRSLEWLAQDSALRRLRRARALRQRGGSDLDLARLEADVLESAQTLQENGAIDTIEALVDMADGRLRKHLLRKLKALRAPSKH